MRKNHFFILLLFILCPLSQTYASVITSAKDGNWSDENTWANNIIPGEGDTVIINGHSVTIPNGVGDITIKRLEITNAADDTAELILDTDDKLTVLEDAIITSENKAREVELEVRRSAILFINGNLYFNRTEENEGQEMLRLFGASDSWIYVGGDFTFDYQNASEQENNNEVFLKDNAILYVQGKSNFYTKGGKDMQIDLADNAQMLLSDDLTMEMKGGKSLIVNCENQSRFQLTGDAILKNYGGTENLKIKAGEESSEVWINGNLSMHSMETTRQVTLEGNGAGTNITVTGNILMEAQSEASVKIGLIQEAKLKIGGNFLRPSNFGAFYMEENTTLELNGSDPQLFPSANIAGSGLDSFYFSNINLNNTSETPIELGEPLVINDNLELKNGIIKSSEDNPIIILDGATVDAGSNEAYVDGPIIKKGTTNGAPFIFPLGKEGVYAPLAISVVSNPNSQFTANYFSDPPPFGLEINNSLNQIGTQDYWSLDKAEGSDDVEVTLSWSNASISGISDTTILVVAHWDEVEGWVNGGRSVVAGELGIGGSGSVTSAFSDPPPFGLAAYGDPPPFGLSFFTFGFVPDNTTNITTLKNNKLMSVFPNPIVDQFSLKINNNEITEDLEIRIFDQIGQLIYTETASINNGTFEFTAQQVNMKAIGIYMMTVKAGDQIYNLKLIRTE